MDIYQRAERKGIFLEETCVGMKPARWRQLMENKVKADKKKIDKLVKLHLPELYHNLTLEFYNPYPYFRTKDDKYFILQHSGHQYFIRINA